MSNNLLLVSYCLLIACLLTYCFLVLSCLFVCVFAEVYPRKLMLHSFYFYHLISYANSYDYVAIKWLCVEIDRNKLKPNPIPISYRLPQVYVQRCLFKLTLSKSPSPFQEANLVQDLKTLTKVMTWFEFYLQMVPILCFL